MIDTTQRDPADMLCGSVAIATYIESAILAGGFSAPEQANLRAVQRSYVEKAAACMFIMGTQDADPLPAP